MEERIKTLETENAKLKKSNDLYVNQQEKMKKHAEHSGSMYALYKHSIIRLREEIKTIDEGERIAKTKQ